MKKIFSGFKDEQDGAIAIEACISLTLFLIVMIALYSVIQVFTVQSMISHAYAGSLSEHGAGKL